MDTHRILMVPPEHYADEIPYSINPWMRKGERIDADLARRQWFALRDVLSKRAQVHVAEVNGDGSGKPDLVYAANAGVVRGKRAIPSRFRFPERQPETEVNIKIFTQQLGYQVIELPEEVGPFEGEGDFLFDATRPIAFGGHGFRSEKRALEAVGEIFGVEVVTLRLTNPHFYHLDTAFCPLQEHLVWYPDGFDEESRATVKRYFGDAVRLDLDEEEAMRFSCNAVCLDDEVVMHEGAAERVVARLEEWGYSVTQTNLSEFLRTGGTAKCLSLHLRG